jgi:hypothetical protein
MGRIKNHFTIHQFPNSPFALRSILLPQAHLKCAMDERSMDMREIQRFFEVMIGE